MSDSTHRSWLVSATVFGGLGVAIFLVGAVLGYCRGAFGDDGTPERGFDWAVKTGLLLVAMSGVLGVVGGLILSKLKLPPLIAYAIVMGLAFAIMGGGGVLLGMSDKSLAAETIMGFIQGAIVGAISGPIIHRRQLRQVQQTQHDGKAASDQAVS